MITVYVTSGVGSMCMCTAEVPDSVTQLRCSRKCSCEDRDVSAASGEQKEKIEADFRRLLIS